MSARLGLLVLAGVLPLLGVSLGTIYTTYQHERERATSQNLNLARALALSVENELRLQISTLEVLATSHALAAGDLVRFRSHAEVVVAHLSPGSNILLLREDGQQLMNTALPSDAPLPVRQELTNHRRVFATGLPSVSNVYFGVVVHRPIVAIDVPVRRADGSVGLILSLNPSLATFDGILGSQKFGKNWLISILDRNALRVARVPSDERVVGEPAVPDFIRVWSGVSEGIAQVTLPAGVPVLAAFSRLPEFGWTVVVAVPAAQLTGPAWRAAIISVTIGLFVLALGLWLAYLVSRGVTGPMTVLRRLAAASDGAGIETGPILTSLPEADEVAEVLRAEARRRTAATARLERALEERTEALVQRDLLLREVYHRVKNNLQIVDGLLAMQGRRSTDYAAKQALLALRDRVHALGLAHQQLMKSTDLKTFDVAPFLHELSRNIVAGSTDRSVRLSVQASALMVTLDFAIPLGLLVTELLTNCLKHVHREGNGQISVTFDYSDASIVLTVSDDGPSPNLPIDIAADEGMKIIRGLVGQLDGVINVHYDNGFHSKIVLKSQVAA